MAVAVAMVATASGGVAYAAKPAASDSSAAQIIKAAKTKIGKIQGLGRNDPVKMGVLLTLSGSIGVIGAVQKRGVEIAVDEINAKGGVLGHKLEMVIRDDAATPSTAVNLARELVEKEKVHFILGTTLSGPALATFQYIDEAEIPMMGSASDDSVADSSKYPFAFSGSPLTAVQAQGMVEASVAAFKPKKVGILGESTAYGDGLVTNYEKYLGEAKTALSGTQRYAQGATDLSAPLDALRRSGAEIVLAAALGGDVIRIVRAMGTMGWNVPLFAASGSLAETVKSSGGPSAVPNLYSINSKLLTFPKGGEAPKATLDYVKQVKQKLGVATLDGVSIGQDAAHYDMVNLFVESIKDAKSVDGTKIRNALQKGQSLPGGVYSKYGNFTPKHHASITPDEQAVVVAASYKDGLFERVGP